MSYTRILEPVSKLVAADPEFTRHGGCRPSVGNMRIIGRLGRRPLRCGCLILVLKPAVVMLLVGVVGCAQPAVNLLTPPEPQVVWPKPPDMPRIRLLGELKSSEDVHPHKSMSQIWKELLYGPSKPAKLVTPYAVAVHAETERIAVADTNGACVHLFDLQKQSYEQKIGLAGQRFECPVALAWVGNDLWVADSKLHVLTIFASGGKEHLIGRDLLKRPAGMTFCKTNELIYVADAGAHAILAFDRQGELVFQFGSRGRGPGQFNFPSQIACGLDDTLVVVDSLNFRVQRLALDGSPLGAFGKKGDAAGDFALPKGVAVGPDGNIWVVDAHFENVQGFTPQGDLLLAWGGEGQGPGEFWLPAGICIDAKRRMWIADSYNRRVQIFELLQ